MSEDQYTKQDPQDQFRSPDEQESDEISHPGATAEMDVEPDHGEDSEREPQPARTRPWPGRAATPPRRTRRLLKPCIKRAGT